MKNPAWFVWKTFSKSLVYFFFLSGALFLITVIFPTIMLLVHPAKRKTKAMRNATHQTFRLMNTIMWALGLTQIDISQEDRKKLKELKSTIVVANHPSLIDITLLIGLLPQADCIVNAALFNMFIVKHVVRRLFVPNSLDFNVILKSCTESLAAGNCLVIFPEGSRTKPGEVPVIRKGSARISLGTGCPVQPIAIETNDVRGLRKGDPYYRINSEGRYTFKFTLQEPVYPEAYRNNPLPIAARRMTAEIYTRIFPDSQRGTTSNPPRS